MAGEIKVKTMKVYRNGAKEKSLRLHVTPGYECGEEYLDPEGKPKLITVEFVRGEAELPEQFAQWLVDKGYASKTKQLILEAA